MSAFYNAPNKDFTRIRNAMLRDTNLSLKAKGLLCLMLSMPPGWVYRMGHIEGLSTDGRDAVRSALKELIAQKYVVRRQSKNHGGRFIEAEYDVSDEIGTAAGFSVAGEAGAGEAATTNTEVTNT